MRLAFKVEKNNKRRGKGAQGRPTHPSSHCQHTVQAQQDGRLRRGRRGLAFAAYFPPETIEKFGRAPVRLKRWISYFLMMYYTVICTVNTGAGGPRVRSDGISFKGTRAEDGCWLITGSSAGSRFHHIAKFENWKLLFRFIGSQSELSVHIYIVLLLRSSYEAPPRIQTSLLFTISEADCSFRTSSVCAAPRADGRAIRV